MYIRSLILVALAIAGAQAQNANGDESRAAPEPYSYGYETDTHSAAEQRDPNGQVTGFYTLSDADGRQRRVEYVADEAGFRAKVQTNELGTKSANSADVEVLAAPPTEGQLIYQGPPQVQQQQFQRVQTVATAAQQPATVGAVQTITNQQRVGYVQQPGYGYTNFGYYPYNGYASGYQASYPAGYGYGYGYNQNSRYGYLAPAGGYGLNQGYYASYNNHLPSQYYRSIQTNQAGYAGAPIQAAGNAWQTVSGYRTVGVAQPAQVAGYSTVSTSSTASQQQQQQAQRSGLGGSSNYIVLKKRASEAAKENSRS